MGACMAGGMWQEGACMARETASAVGGTHPTGMHSCSEHWFVSKNVLRFTPPPFPNLKNINREAKTN